jgi:uncharacterized membrane protein
VAQLEVLSFLSQAICLYFFYFILFKLFMHRFLTPIIVTVHARRQLNNRNYAHALATAAFTRYLTMNLTELLEEVTEIADHLTISKIYKRKQKASSYIRPHFKISLKNWVRHLQEKQTR